MKKQVLRYLDERIKELKQLRDTSLEQERAANFQSAIMEVARIKYHIKNRLKKKERMKDSLKDKYFSFVNRYDISEMDLGLKEIKSPFTESQKIVVDCGNTKAILWFNSAGFYKSDLTNMELTQKEGDFYLKERLQRKEQSGQPMKLSKLKTVSADLLGRSNKEIIQLYFILNREGDAKIIDANQEYWEKYTDDNTILVKRIDIEL